MDGYDSCLAAINYGINQRSTVGPLLFFSYLYDLTIKKLNKLLNGDLKQLVTG